MDKTAIKNFSVRARKKLIEDIIQKAYELGITENETKQIEVFEGGFRVKGLENSKIYKKYEIDQRAKLISKINEKGLEQVVEEVAYTWFNRFIALRFMEVNEYLPTGVRVLSSIEEGKTEPDIIKEALEIDLEIDKDIVYDLMDRGDTEDLYKYLIIKQCNQLGAIMPMVFEEISDYTELLLPDRLLQEGSVVMDLVESIEEDDYKEQVEIIGWMYQYYISEKKDEVFAGLKKNKKITKENIPAATQLFTPKWIVKYMVENSLGRLWLESHPDEELKATWKYYLEEAEQDPEVQQKLDELKDPNLNPEDIKILDPAMGSGHILVYAFDVMYDIYLKANYSEREIPTLILEKNLYGLDIDDRAGQLTAFALMMKARSKNRRVFRKKIDLNICSIQESNNLTEGQELKLDSPILQYFLESSEYEEREQLQYDLKYIIDSFIDAKEYGSILDIKKVDFDNIEKRLYEINNEHTDMFNQGYRNIILDKVPFLLKQAKIMSKKYDVVCTNPPYMGSKGMDIKLGDYLKKNYSEVSSDMSTVFMKKSLEYNKKNGFMAMINIPSWMFLSTYKGFRTHIINNSIIVNMLHLGRGVFGSDFGTTSFIFRGINQNNYNGTYRKLFKEQGLVDSADQKEEWFLENMGKYNMKQDEYFLIPGNPIAYWLSNTYILSFLDGKLCEYTKARIGLITGDNNRFLRLWHEVNSNNIGFNTLNVEESIESNLKWFPYQKGGTFRKWYGNHEYVVNWKNDGTEMKYDNSINGRIRSHNYNGDLSFKKGISWSSVTIGKFSCRYSPTGFMFDAAGPLCKVSNNDYLYLVLAYLSSKVAKEFLEVLNPTINMHPGYVESLPFKFNEILLLKDKIDNLSKSNIDISCEDWDSTEISWNFKQHPLIKYSSFKDVYRSNKIHISFKIWNDLTNENFKQLKSNEEELNRIFINIYGLQDELTPEVEDKDITISKADREKDIKSLISYALGCMFGRYSLDQEGLIYAGGDFTTKFKVESDEVMININDDWKSSSIDVTMDNILIIADDDYFEDDITNRFIDFIKVTFGLETLEENIDYIAETLKKKTNETSRQTIRRFFVKDFYKDHLKTYKKRPIYWQFDSGKQDGFKALIYMHRYDSSTVARVRTDYLHEIQKKYEAEINHIDILLDSELTPREESSALKKKTIINKQIAECKLYDQFIGHVANQEIEFDLDDGVKVNYEKFQGVLVPQVDGSKPIKSNLLTKI